MTLKINSRKINFASPVLILAPMAGITDLPFRLICKQFGADIVYSEMVSSTGLFCNSKKTEDLLQTIPEEQPLAVQLFGAEPKHFANATKIINKILAACHPEFSSGSNKIPDQVRNNNKDKNQIDINFGCPVKKVIKQGAGCALMEKPNLARKIIQEVLKNTSLPVSIKIRTGMKNIDALEFLGTVADLDWETVVVHGRTFEKGFGGKIDFDLIRKIKEEYPEKQIIANGGIMGPKDAKNVLEKTKTDGIAIARGALGNPWIFRQIKDYLEFGKYSQPSIEEIKNVAIEHAKLFLKYKGEKNIREFRKHLSWYFKGIPGAKKIRSKLFEINNFDDILEIIKIFN